jgi:hypothetical protein
MGVLQTGLCTSAWARSDLDALVDPKCAFLLGMIDQLIADRSVRQSWEKRTRRDAVAA